MRKLTHGSTFSGIGGPEVAATMLGWDNLFHCEINPFGRQVLDYWYPNAESYEDITKTDFSKWRGKIDVLTGGFPCQPFSTAGKRKGADDERYLWPFMLRCIEQVQPTWFVGENVGGILSMVEQGETTLVGSEADLFGETDTLYRYRQQSTFTIERICKNLEAVGYSVQPVLIPACGVGAPHRRDRVFIVAHRTVENSDCMVREVGEDEELEYIKRQRNSCSTSNDGKIELSYSDAYDGLVQSCKYDGESMGEADSRRTPRGHCDGSVQSNEGSAADGGGTERTSDRTDGERERKQLQRAMSDADIHRLQGRVLAESHDEQGRNQEGRTFAFNTYDVRSLLPSERWRAFPTQSPVYRGNDGLPFDVDDLTISFGKWKTESLKAYGNAIVPQVMYMIFQAIDSIENDKQEQQ